MLLVIDGHPERDSFCAGLAEAYASGAREAGAQVELLHVGDVSQRRKRLASAFSAASMSW